MKRSKPKSNKRHSLRRRILIMCEGETERNYFQGIKEDPAYKQVLSAIAPQVVVAKHPTPKQVVKEAVEKMKKAKEENNAYDNIWVVFDHDNHHHRHEAYKIAIQKNFKIAFSSISFEKWFLIHFVRISQPFQNASDLIKKLRKHYPEYKKGEQNDFNNLKDKLDYAFENALWLREQVSYEQKHITDYNPWTDVDILVRELITSK